MTTPISLQINADMKNVTQNVVDLFESIKSHYVVNYTKEAQGSGFGFNFGHNPICENSIGTGYKEATATLRICLRNSKFTVDILGKSSLQIYQEIAKLRLEKGNDIANRHITSFQGILDARYGNGIVTLVRCEESNIYVSVNITTLSDAAINATSALLQHSDLQVKASPSRTYQV
jgi:hypothetical protein